MFQNQISMYTRNFYHAATAAQALTIFNEKIRVRNLSVYKPGKVMSPKTNIKAKQLVLKCLMNNLAIIMQMEQLQAFSYQSKY